MPGPDQSNDRSQALQGAGANEQPPRPRMAIRNPWAVVVFLLISVGGLAGDLWSKQAVFNYLLSEPGLEVRARRVAQDYTADEALRGHLLIEQPVGAGLKFTVSTNKGVVFGLPMPPWVVSIVSIVTIGLVFLFFATGDARAWSMHAGLGCILAGALGNLYDRQFGIVHIPGFKEPITNQVRDFINLSDLKLNLAGHELSYPFVFNIADVLLVVGVILLMVNWWLSRRPEHTPAKKAA